MSELFPSIERRLQVAQKLHADLTAAEQRVIGHPGYFGLFDPTPTFPAQCADQIVASFNPQLATATTSPAAVEIEAHVIRAVARRAGMPPRACSHFTAGGSEANCTAVLLALTRANAYFARIGARAFVAQPIFYVSRDSHLAWVKIAHQVGIGRDALRLVNTDGHGQLNLSALQATMDADSITIDAHKWCATTMGCGMFLLREPTLLSSAFQASNTYMPSNTPGVDPYVTTPQWSRRFVGLRLFRSLAAAGWDGYGQHVKRAISLAAMLKERLTALGWKIVNQSPAAVVCAVTPVPTDLRAKVRRVVASGRAWVSVAVFENCEVLELALPVV